jgi:hypothetical protein
LGVTAQLLFLFSCEDWIMDNHKEHKGHNGDFRISVFEFRFEERDAFHKSHRMSPQDTQMSRNPEGKIINTFRVQGRVGTSNETGISCLGHHRVHLRRLHPYPAERTRYKSFVSFVSFVVPDHVDHEPARFIVSTIL